MIHLIDELFSCKVPDLTPEGKKVYTIFPLEELNRLFNLEKL